MTQRASFLAKTHMLDQAGRVWARDHNGRLEHAYTVPDFESEYGRLIVSAPLLYRAIDIAIPMLDTIGRIFEAHNLEDHVGPLHNLEGGLEFALRTATFPIKFK